MARSSRSGKRRSRSSSRKKKSFLRRYGYEIALGILFIAIIGAIWSVVSGGRVDHGEATITEQAGDFVEQAEDIFEEQVINDTEDHDTASLEKRIASLTAPKSKQKSVFTKKPLLGLIIDDLGRDRAVVKQLMALNIPIAFSILPHLKHSRSVALDAKKHGQVVMLHLPMEPKSNGISLGDGALRVTHSKREILKLIDDHLNSVPGAEGINNHMGSLFTEQGAKMSIVIDELKKRDMFFIDSRTSPQTKAYDTAIKAGVPTASRRVFLDNDRKVELVEKRLMELVESAQRSGSAIGIGHPYPETIAALQKNIAKLESMGVRIVPVTALLN